ncbi:SRPBCC family protein [Kitasatospora sp. NPDC101801]|uniref:SRPBCC family protein n=1 Tax=Kitasatospora sp. NPDC101801 TaxID=3364103 RepID=UPI0038101948
MSHIAESVEVSVPVEDAYREWSRFTAFPEFMHGIEEVAAAPGATVHWVAGVDGVRREFDTEVTERVPGERIAWRSVAGVEHSGVVTFHALETGRSRVMLQIDHTPHGVLDAVGDWLGFIAHEVQRCLRDFKQHVEGRAVAH